jgi:hypothetical protein
MLQTTHRLPVNNTNTKNRANLRDLSDVTHRDILLRCSHPSFTLASSLESKKAFTMSGFLASIFEAFSSAEKTKSADAAAKDDAASTQPRADGHSTQSRPVDGSLSSPQDSNALHDEPRQAERSYPLEASDGRAHFLPGAAALPPVSQPHSFRFANQEDATAAALAIPHPAATAAATATGSHHAGGLSAFRMRSLSRMFTRLPEKALPSYPQMVLDQLEFMMHVILLETNPVRALQHMANLKAVYETFGSLPQGKRLLRSGRLYSRSMLCGLAADFVILKVDGGENDMAPHVDGDADDNETSEEAERQITAASDLPSESWASSQQQLATLRAILIQKNANAAPKFQKDSEEERDDSDEIDEQLTKHAMMTVDYDEIYRLLAVQVELTRLKEKLEDMMEDSDHPSECTVLSTSASDETPHASGGGGGIRGGYDKKLSAKSINKNVQKAINEFMKNLSSVYPPAEDTSPRAVEFEDDDDEGFDDLDVDDNEEAQGHESGESAMESPVKSKRRYSISNIPKELHSLVLTELYSPKRKPQRSTDLVARLLTDIMSITSDAPTPALTNPGVFSHANLQSKVSLKMERVVCFVSFTSWFSCICFCDCRCELC